MDVYQIIAIVVVLTAVLNHVNRRVLKLHPTIGMMLAGALVAVAVAVVGQFRHPLAVNVRHWVRELNFNELVLQGILGFLLFAGSLKINLSRLLKRIWPIGIFAVGGVVFSAFIIAWILNAVSQCCNLGLSFMDCLLFGAIISPTDPIAVLSILKQVGAPQNLEMDIEGESLFNDGIGVVMFLVVVRVMTSSKGVSVGNVLGLFGLEAVGGILLGWLYGVIASRMIRNNDDVRTQILLTLSIATGGYQFADVIHASGPLAMVVAGIVVGNDKGCMRCEVRSHLDNFWDVVDEVGNAILFMLVGLEMLLVANEALPEWRICLLAAAVTVPAVLVSRYFSVLIPYLGLKWKFPFSRGTLAIMTWGGLRGGLPLAMALCIPTTELQISRYHITHAETLDRAMLLMMTYSVVIFSILVQGLTIKPLVRFFKNPAADDCE
ncbi:MAG TPA: sodium:proton antiporter [Phycisphaerae bacterium]|nr:sodium:proton antiporter [Phycisphaerae bacterium]HPS52312.1 sodium:proton antiporter [Phycisphaerae bacterium]